ncbi:MAG: hypothetical protein J6T35_02010 [Bacteroidales bacterium]|nr:hypothetical protein [Bacteroidales bacterium]
MRNEYKFKVYPTEYVRGFVPTYCLTMESAMDERKKMQKATGVEWRVRRIS